MTEVTITVSTISDDSYPITILDTDRIAEVKKSVEAAEGTPAAEQVSTVRLIPPFYALVHLLPGTYCRCCSCKSISRLSLHLQS